MLASVVKLTRLSQKNGGWVLRRPLALQPFERYLVIPSRTSTDVLEILVNRAEMIAHMNPSGLDAKTCLSDQPIRFIKNVGFEELAMDLSAYLVIADTGVYGHTREAIQVVESKGKEALPFLYALGELTQQAEEAIKTKDAVKLGEILTKAHGNLKRNRS